MSQFPSTERTKVKRKPERGTYDRELIYSILDQAFVCSVGFIVDGLPFVVPTNYVRVGDKLHVKNEGGEFEIEGIGLLRNRFVR